MHQVTQNRACQADHARTPELLGCSALIHLGKVGSRERFQLVLQVLAKMRRLRQGDTRLIVAVEEGKALPVQAAQPCCSYHTPVELQQALDRYHGNGLVLVPISNEAPGDAILHALASGVPLEALNFHRQPVGDCMPPSQHGDAFLAVARSCDPRPN